MKIFTVCVIIYLLHFSKSSYVKAYIALSAHRAGNFLVGLTERHMAEHEVSAHIYIYIYIKKYISVHQIQRGTEELRKRKR